MTEPTECPRCGEIELRHMSTISVQGKPTIEEWWCSECHHFETTTTNMNKQSQMKNWRDMEPEEVVSRIYWQRGQIPPKDWREDWPKIKEQLERLF